MRLQLGSDDRDVLLGELDGFLATTAALYRQIGREWAPDDPSELPPDVAPVARAREQLAGEQPWRLEGSAEELTFLLGRLRDGAELALQRGAQPSPGAGAPVAMNAADAEGTDAQLDVLRVTEALLQRVASERA